MQSPKNKETKAKWDEESWKREHRFLIHELCIINLAVPGSHQLNLNLISQVRNLHSCSFVVSGIPVVWMLILHLAFCQAWSLGTMSLLCIRRSVGIILFHPLGWSKGRVHQCPDLSKPLSLSISFCIYIASSIKYLLCPQPSKH